MQRTIVQVVKMRMGDLVPGDVINKNPDEPRGWFLVYELQDLPNDGLAVLASTARNSINGAPDDIVGVQVRQVVELPDAPAPKAQEAVPVDESAAATQEAPAPAAPQPDVAPPSQAPAAA